jgi:hypothetical protein
VTRAWPTIEDDAELIGGDGYAPYIYIGNLNGTAAHVVAAADPVPGFTGYCRSGITTLEQCGHTVTAIDARICSMPPTGEHGPGTPVCDRNLIVYHRDGATTSAGGDSGAPIYLPWQGEMHIRGIHIARGTNVMYGVRWSTIATQFGVSIVT